MSYEDDIRKIAEKVKQDMDKAIVEIFSKQEVRARSIYIVRDHDKDIFSIRRSKKEAVEEAQNFIKKHAPTWELLSPGTTYKTHMMRQTGQKFFEVFEWVIADDQ